MCPAFLNTLTASLATSEGVPLYDLGLGGLDLGFDLRGLGGSGVATLFSTIFFVTQVLAAALPALASSMAVLHMVFQSPSVIGASP